MNRLRMPHCQMAILVAVITTLTLGSAATRAETTVGTEITSLPYVITTPGTYYLNRDFKQDFPDWTPIIDIQASNVTLDFNGHVISTLGYDPGRRILGVHSFDQPRVTLRNGSLVGFFVGVGLEADYHTKPIRAYGVLVEDIKVSDCVWEGIHVDADDSQVRRCQAIRTRGGTDVNFKSSAGICITGNGMRVMDNDVSVALATGGGPSVGIFIHDAYNCFVVGNRVNDATYAFYCVYDSNGQYRDNLTCNVTTPFYGLYWHDSGGNL